MKSNEERLQDLLAYVDSLTRVHPSEIPGIDLYMDQVTTFMDSHLNTSKWLGEDKILTKTMINNYAKNNLLPPPIKTAKAQTLWASTWRGPSSAPTRWVAQNPEYSPQGGCCNVPPPAEAGKRPDQAGGYRPEEPGAAGVIAACHDEVRISIAHTCTSYDTANAAFDAGATHMTHLYNAMPGITHREPGPIIAALERGAEVELITDNVHIHPAMVRFTFNTFGDDHVILIADSMMACGLPDGQYSLGGQAITVKGPRATLTEHPDTIAGSTPACTTA